MRKRAGVLPSELDYVEAHGTGTTIGDVIEANALGNVMGRGRDPARPLRIGSVKSNIGHLEPAAGIAGLIKTALSLRHKTFLPSLHCERPNASIDFERLKLKLSDKAADWDTGRRRLAGVSSYGFGGANAHVVLAEAETAASPPPEKRLAALAAFRWRPRAAACVGRDGGVRSVARTGRRRPGPRGREFRARRHGHRHRMVILGRTAGEAAVRIKSRLGGSNIRGVVSGNVAAGGRIAFIFSGQGALWPGCGLDLFEQDAVFRAELVRCDRAALRPHLGMSVLPALFGPDSAQDIARTELAQPALFAIQYALANLLKLMGRDAIGLLGPQRRGAGRRHDRRQIESMSAARLIVERGRAMRETRGLGRMLQLAAPGSNRYAS